MIILTPTHLAKDCFLSEALDWVAFNRFPLHLSVNGEDDFRFDKHFQGLYTPQFPHIEILNSPNKRVGLSNYPALDAFEMNEKSEIEDHISKIIEFSRSEEDWWKERDEFLEIPRAKLILPLLEGRLIAYGRRLPKDFIAPEDELDGGGDYFSIEFEEVSPKCWQKAEIDWTRSALRKGNEHFCNIYVDVNQLFKLYPIPLTEKTELVSLIADQYVTAAETEITPKFSSKGRPSYNWEEFYIELFTRILANTVPRKQEAFIADMSEWCQEKWGAEIARSTLLQKISPFFQKFIKK